MYQQPLKHNRQIRIAMFQNELRLHKVQVYYNECFIEVPGF